MTPEHQVLQGANTAVIGYDLGCREQLVARTLSSQRILFV